MKGGTVPLILMFWRDSPVTDEPSVLQVIPGQIQWEEFDEVLHRLRDCGFFQCCFSFSRTACS
jgi:hypothetical protein